ncbi:MAG TPA: NADH-quinone oxidoreductase subunit L [Acidimicrobiia bacterium]
MHANDVLDLVWLVPALPLFGAAFLLLFGKRIGEPIAGWIGSATLALSFGCSVAVFAALRDLRPEHRQHVVDLFTWLPSGGLKVEFGFLADPLSVAFILFITGVATLIHIYSIGYMHGDPRFSRFFAYMNLFVAAMLVLVLGSSFLMTFLGWEGVGLCSYLLIAFWFERPAAANAGKKAFITTRIGDVGFMVAMFLIFAELGTLDYTGPRGALVGAFGLSSGTATAIALLLFFGAVGKSAQFPLHFWLPDAMEGPTPVSALIHAATMVTAGVFLVARAHQFFEVSGDAMTVVAWIGGATAFLAGTVALVQPDIKRVLAYSTISQLGYMFLALGVGAYSAAIFLVITHAFFKATLFLGAGTVIHGNGDNQDMRIMGGFRKYMPYTATAFVIAWLAIAGVPPFSGFFAKDGVLEKAFEHSDYGLWVVGLAAAVLTGAYMTRQVYLTFMGNERWQPAADAETAAVVEPATPTVDSGEPPRTPTLHHPPHEGSGLMVGPVLMLAGLAVVGGLLDVPLKGVEFLDEWLAPVFADSGHIASPSFLGGLGLSGLAFLMGLIGIGIAYAYYHRGLVATDQDPFDQHLGVAGRVFGHAYYYDEGISRAVDGPIRAGAAWIAQVIDTRVIDGAVNGVAKLVRYTGDGFGRLQTGLVRNYVLAVVLGTAALLVYLLVWAAR